MKRNGHLGFPVQEARGLGALGHGLDLVPLCGEAADIAGDLLLCDVLGCGAHDNAVLFGLDLVEN